MKKLGICCLFVFCCLFFVVFAIGCGQGGGGTNTDYFPLTNGYSWAYSLQSGGSTFSMLITCEGTKSISSNVTASILKAWYSTGSTGESYYKTTNDGAFYYGSPGQTTTEAKTYLSYPLTLGKKWCYSSTSDTQEVTGTGTTVTVPAGTFNNCCIVSSGTTYIYQYYYAPNVGMIKYITTYNGAIVATMELTSKNF